MQRCYIHPDRWNENALALDAKEAHHLIHVLRLGPGTPILAFDGEGHEAETRLHGGDAPDQAFLEVIQMITTASEPLATQWILVPSIIKGSRMDSLIEKATELGSHRIMPIQTSRCVVRLDPQQAANKVARWERIAISAAKQCGTPQLPTIDPVTDLAGALQRLKESHIPVLQGSLSGDPQPIAKVAHALLAQQPTAIAILTGPEGDFSPDEYQQAAAAGCIPVSLGKLTLRAETATIYALSVLQALQQEKGVEQETGIEPATFSLGS